jgi:spermidine synthase
VNVELMRDAERPDGWWLLVGGSEQSFVDTADPLHLEFEYVQLIAHVLLTCFEDAAAVTALHLGGGLCTVPRWLAARHPGSEQRVVEHSTEIAGLCASLGQPPGVTIEIADALDAVMATAPGAADLVVCDVYDGPETVTSLFTLPATRRLHELVRRGGVVVCNLSDAAPFALTQVVAATLRAVFGEVVMLAEPPVLRGRRSGNLVLAATDSAVDLVGLTRRAAGGAVRARVVAGEDLTGFIAGASPARRREDVPASGESTGRSLF